MNTARDGHPHSWTDKQDDEWEAFRSLIQAGIDPDLAARKSGLPPL